MKPTNFSIMKPFSYLFALIIMLSACEGEYRGERQEVVGAYPDTLHHDRDTVVTGDTGRDTYRYTYGNDRFRNVTVTKLSNNDFLIRGEARVTEANVRYVVEDGHHQLASGHTTASDAGPNWGTFELRLDVDVQDPHRTIMLILFEESMEDGSHLSELPIRLDQPQPQYEHN